METKQGVKNQKATQKLQKSSLTLLPDSPQIYSCEPLLEFCGAVSILLLFNLLMKDDFSKLTINNQIIEHHNEQLREMLILKQ